MAEIDNTHVEESIGNPDVLKLERDASQVVNETLALLIKNLAEGKKVVDLCKIGDDYVNERVKAFKIPSKQKSAPNQPTLRGPAFPTTINVNDIICNYSPVNDVVTLQKGDVVRIDVSVHLDGYIATGATTVVLTDDVLKGKEGNVFAAVAAAQQAALRLMKPGHTNQEISAAFEKIAAEFGVFIPDGILSHQLTRWVIDGAQTILQKKSFESAVETFEFQDNEVYSLDIVFSTDNIRFRDNSTSLNETTIWKRQFEMMGVDLKRKTSQQLINDISKKYNSLPFSMRWLPEEQRNNAKLGIIELFRNKMVDPYPILHAVCEGKPFVVQLKTTVLVTPSSVLPTTGINCPGGIAQATAPFVNKYEPEAKINDKEIIELLKTSLKIKKKAEKAEKKEKMEVEA